MGVIEPLHHAGLASFVIILLSLGLILKTWGGDHTKSLSGHGAQHRKSYLIFASALVPAGLLFCAFALWWVMPTLYLPPIFGGVLVLTALCELAAAFIPDNGGTNSVLHRTAAWTMAVGMLVIVLLLYATPHISHFAKIILGFLMAYMLIDWCLFLFVTASKRYFLFFQATYVLSFYAAVLAATYIR